MGVRWKDQTASPQTGNPLGWIRIASELRCTHNYICMRIQVIRFPLNGEDCSCATCEKNAFGVHRALIITFSTEQKISPNANHLSTTVGADSWCYLHSSNLQVLALILCRLQNNIIYNNVAPFCVKTYVLHMEHTHGIDIWLILYKRFNER